METFIVIPCLNEQENLAATCTSLGFGEGYVPQESLVLVDNGSTDDTYRVITDIINAVQHSDVFVVQEPERGFVPARDAGVREVMRLARAKGIEFCRILLIQADADTIYLPGFVQAMKAAALADSTNSIYEGVAVTCREFSKQFPEFDNLCKQIDRAIEPWFAQENSQLVVDDKVCAFFLADYVKWGGHRREFDTHKQELYAETTRLYMRARLTFTGKRVTVEDAIAVPSRRKLWVQGPAYFACAGFPRHQEWIARWGNDPHSSLLFLENPHVWPSIGEAIRSRQRHELALFSVLPLICSPEAKGAPLVADLATNIKNSIGLQPARLLEAALALADEEGGVLDHILDRLIE